MCSNDDPRVTLTYLMSRTSLLPYAFELDIFLKNDFLNTVEAKVMIVLT